MTKIEPVASIVPCYTPSGKRVALNTQHQGLPIGTVLYTEAQLRQLGEACAALLENQKYMVLNTFKIYTPDELCRAQRENDKHTARMIRNLIKEMLP